MNNAIAELKNPHSQSTDAVLLALSTNKEGSTSKEAQQRLAKFGSNELQEQEQISSFRIFIDQFNNFLVIILLAAVAVSFFIGESSDAIVILIILLINS